MEPHEHDRFHPPTSDDPYWTETCWFTFAVPERLLSGQLYPFFRPNQRVAAGGAFFWDPSGSQIWNCRYAKNFWHLPLPADADLADLTLPNGIRIRRPAAAIEPVSRMPCSRSALPGPTMTPSPKTMRSLILGSVAMHLRDAARCRWSAAREAGRRPRVQPNAITAR